MSKKVLGNSQRGLLFVVSAPAGTGKSTLVEMLRAEFPDVVAESCSSTTRPKRAGEVEGLHYEFISVAEFESHIKAGAFLEHATVFGNYYGTRKQIVNALLAEGKHVVLVIDTQGAMQVLKQMPEAITLFISPPSWEELKRRLLNRQTESDEMIEERLKWARHEIEMMPYYHYHITNDNLVVTYQILRGIFIAEEHKNRNRRDYVN